MTRQKKTHKQQQIWTSTGEILSNIQKHWNKECEPHGDKKYTIPEIIHELAEKELIGLESPQIEGEIK